MGNPADLERAKQGKEVWNKWAAENPEACVDFSNLRIENTDFSGFIFPAKASFKRTNFVERTDFTKAHFSDFADFHGAKFSQVFFDGAQFCTQADFDSTHFCSSSFFRATQFSHNATFTDAKFSETDFTESEFAVMADFDRSAFSDYALFKNALFIGSASFESASFNITTDFRGTRFFESSNFNLTKFDGTVHFDGAQFEGVCFFEAVQFSGNADFTESKFNDSVYFSKAIFETTVYFNNTSFFDDTIFTAATMHHHSFSGASFSQTPDFYRAETSISFQGVNFGFNEDDDAGHINYAERLRVLKSLAAQSNDHEMELLFFAHEMRAKRRDELKGKNKRAERFWNYVYDKTSFYGTSIARPTIGLLGVYFAFLTLYAVIQYTLISDQPCQPQLTYLFYLTSENLFPLPGGIKLKPDEISDCLYGGIRNTPAIMLLLTKLESIFGTIFLFLIVLGFRNKFKIR